MPKPVERYDEDGWDVPPSPASADRETQYSRYLDCGPGGWDERDLEGNDGDL